MANIAEDIKPLFPILMILFVLFQILGYADHVFTGLFTIEIILKVVFKSNTFLMNRYDSEMSPVDYLH